MTGPLVDAGWLAGHRSSLRLADVRSTGSSVLNRAAFEAGHIEGAIFFDMEGDLAGPGGGRHPLPDAAVFAELLGRRGIGSGDTVVVYDDAAGSAAARLWWMLRSLGNDDVALLDGGLQAWVAAGNETTREEVELPPAVFETQGWTGLVDGDELAGLLGEVTLLDARNADRYRGHNEHLDPVAGHIPTAISLPMADNLGPGGRFRSAAELATTFADFAADDVVAYCGSGVTACHTLLAMEVAGITGARLYPGSWSDWITDPDRPRATGPDPGTP